MKKIRIPFIFAVAAFCLAVSFGMLCLTGMSRHTEAAELNTEQAIKEEYARGEWFEIPVGSLTVGGKTYAAVSVLYFPDGTATRENSLFLETEGIYTLTYTASVDKKIYSESIEITVKGTSAPSPAKIEIDCGEYEKAALPKAVTGKPYKLFEAAASVGKIKTDVKTEVFYRYGNHSKLRIEIGNGCFIPEWDGEYEIVYSARNFYKETTAETLTVTAVSDYTELAIVTEPDSCLAGEETEIKVPAVSKDERTGSLRLICTAVCGEYSEELYNGVYKGEKITYTFERTGKWQIEWTVSDYVESSAATSEMTVESVAASFDGESEKVRIEPVFLIGRTYSVPNVYVKTYTENGLSLAPAPIVYSYGNGTEIAVTDNLITVPQTEEKTITVKWRWETLEKTITVPIAKLLDSAGKIDTSALFVSDNHRAITTEDGIEMDLASAKSAMFANKLHAASFDVQLSAASFASGTGFTVAMTDALNSSERIVLSFVLSSASITVRTNGGGSVKLDAAEGERGKEIRISYAAETASLKINDKAIGTGNFSGFSGGEVWLEFSTSASAGKITLGRINGQKLNSIKNDLIAPRITVNGSYSASYKVGDGLSTFPARGLDVLDGYCPVTLNITNVASGEYVRTSEGEEINGLDASLTHSLNLTERGRYRIQYTVKDLSGRETSEVMYIDIVGGTIPMLETGEIKQTVAQVGYKLELPEYKATDPLGGEVVTFICVYDPDGKGVLIDESVGYTFWKAGSYKIVIGAFDADGNMCSDYYYVEVAA